MYHDSCYVTLYTMKASNEGINLNRLLESIKYDTIKIPHRHISQYNYISDIEEGTYGRVTKQCFEDTVIALKEIRLFTNKINLSRLIQEELEIFQMTDHPNIIKLNGLVSGGSQRSIYFEFPFYITTLHTLTNTPQMDDVKLRKSCIKQILQGLEYLDQKQIIHRDLTPFNIFLSEDNGLVIGDFNVSKKITPTNKLSPAKTTLFYKAPEVLFDCKEYDGAVDVWALATIVYEIYNHGKVLFEVDCDIELASLMIKVMGLPTYLDEYRDLDFFKFLTFESSEKTVGIETFVSNEETESHILDLLKSILTFDSKKRPKPSQLLELPYFN